MKRILFFIFLAGTNICFSQLKHFSVNLSTNYPVIGTVIRPSQVTSVPIASSPGFYSQTINTGKIKESYDHYPGFVVSGSFAYNVSKKIFVTSGLSIHLIRYKKSTYVTLSEPTNFWFADSSQSVILRYPTTSASIDQDDRIGRTTSLYLQIPFLAGTTLLKDKLLIEAGGTMSVLLEGTQYKQQFAYQPIGYGGYGFHTTKDKSSDGFSNLLLGTTLRTTYLFTKNFGVEASAQHFFTPIYDKGSQGAGKAKYNVFSLGFAHYFSK